MKKLAILIFALASVAQANECVITTKSSVRLYPLALAYDSFTTEAVDLEDCMLQAKVELGKRFMGNMTVASMESSGTIRVEYVVRKVKYKYVQDGIKYTGSIR